jgi:hypothetical protein
MTALISWVGVDARGPASVYLASDSRITWPGTRERWDYGRKVFACTASPEVFGFCGDALVGTQILAQLVALIDSQLLFSFAETPGHKAVRVLQFIDQSLTTYPRTSKEHFQVVYATRQGSGLPATFAAFTLTWSQEAKATVSILPMPGHSDLVAALGSGAASVRRSFHNWSQSDVGGTSRAVNSAFCDGLRCTSDVSTGGAPQLAGLYRVGQPRVFGTVWRGALYYNALPVGAPEYFTDIEWRNELFERSDPSTLGVLRGAQRQPAPLSLEPR